MRWPAEGSVPALALHLTSRRSAMRGESQLMASSRHWGLAGIAVGVIVGVLASATVYLYSAQSHDDGASQSGSVQVLGSESMRPAVTACAEDFMTRNPDADIIVKGGGSGDGVAALLHGIVDIGMTSRELSQRERDYAVGRGFAVAVFPMALDGVTIVVNHANPVTALSIDQLREIFTGKIRNWRELEGFDGEILPFARAAGSGTASLFGERALGEEEYGPSVQRLPTNEAIVAEVATRPGAIGYAGLGALRVGGDRIKAVALTASAQPAVIATPATIIAGTYPLSRKLYLATAGAPLGTAKAFIDFCLSASGQALFEHVGYVPIKSAAR
jgi:phosphate transport system substrate-binding protein